MKVYSDNIDNSKIEMPHDKFDMILKYSKLSFILMVCITVGFSILGSFFGYFIYDLYLHIEAFKSISEITAIK